MSDERTVENIVVFELSGDPSQDVPCFPEIWQDVIKGKTVILCLPGKQATILEKLMAGAEDITPLPAGTLDDPPEV